MINLMCIYAHTHVYAGIYVYVKFIMLASTQNLLKNDRKLLSHPGELSEARLRDKDCRDGGLPPHGDKKS